MNNEAVQEILESISPLEKKIIPFLKKGATAETIEEESKVGLVSVVRALNFLQNKGLVELENSEERFLNLNVNGLLYRKKGLPERRLLEIVSEKKATQLEEAKEKSGLTDDEFRASLGALKGRAMIDTKNGRIVLNATADEISKKTLEEKLLESLPKKISELQPEEIHAMKILEKRKDIIVIEKQKTVAIKITKLGQEIFSKINLTEELIEELTPEMIKKNSWKGKKFRRYDVLSGVPKISGGKAHFVNQSIDYARKIWTDMGFKEMTGEMVQPSFWNFDALFTAQDHPVRELQDTFFIKNKTAELPDRKLVEKIKSAHESGAETNSKGWEYSWNENEAKTVALRTHTTCLSARTLYQLSKSEKKEGKFFAIGKCFRNETVDWSHGFEFNQTEGIVVDKNANFRQLIGYLKEFFSKMGFEKIRFVPAYFPYTEPSVEIHWWHPEKKIWLELGGAGIFRPEVTKPLLGEVIPVLAWGPGFDRIIMDYYKIKDLREMYSNDIKQLREMKFWIK